MPGCSRTDPATVRHLVVVASPDPSTTDKLADLLRGSCTVRTAYTTAEIRERLDPSVDVVLVDPDLSPDAVGSVRTDVAARDLECQVGILAPRTVEEGPDDVVVSPAAPGEEVHDRVTQLATRARYRKTLEEYYGLASASARLEDDDAAEERDRLQARLERLSRRLDEVAECLDGPTLFRTVLDRDGDW